MSMCKAYCPRAGQGCCLAPSSVRATCRMPTGCLRSPTFAIAPPVRPPACAQAASPSQHQPRVEPKRGPYPGGVDQDRGTLQRPASVWFVAALLMATRAACQLDRANPCTRTLSCMHADCTERFFHRSFTTCTPALACAATAYDSRPLTEQRGRQSGVCSLILRVLPSATSQYVQLVVC